MLAPRTLAVSDYHRARARVNANPDLLEALLSAPEQNRDKRSANVGRAGGDLAPTLRQSRCARGSVASGATLDARTPAPQIPFDDLVELVISDQTVGAERHEQHDRAAEEEPREPEYLR